MYVYNGHAQDLEVVLQTSVWETHPGERNRKVMRIFLDTSLWLIQSFNTYPQTKQKE